MAEKTIQQVLKDDGKLFQQGGKKMAYNKEMHAYDVEVTKSYTVIFKVIAHSEE